MFVNKKCNSLRNLSTCSRLRKVRMTIKKNAENEVAVTTEVKEVKDVAEPTVKIKDKEKHE